MSVKQRRGWVVPGCGSAVGTGGAEGLERMERMVSTLFLKKAAKLLHCFSVESECRGLWGLRRWFMVEKSCLEFPVLLLMMEE